MENNYQPRETYLGISPENSMENNYVASNSEENITYSQSDEELKINYLSKNDQKSSNEFNLFDEKYNFNIDTLKSLRISHSLDKSSNSQSLIDIINKGNYNFEGNENDMNLINKNSNKNEIKEGRSNNNKFDMNNNYKNELNIKLNKGYNSQIKNINNRNTSPMTNISTSNNKKNDLLNNKDKSCASFSHNSNNHFRKNKNSSNKFKIDEMFKEKFEEKIKPKSNKLSKYIDRSFINGKQINTEVDKVNKNSEEKIKAKTLEHMKRINSSLDHNLKNSNNSYKVKFKEKIKDNNKENKFEENLININDFDNSIKRKELVFPNIGDNSSSLEINEDIEEEKKNGYKINNDNLETLKIKEKEESNQLIKGLFGEKPDSSLDDSKNVMISELDIEISTSLEKKESNNRKLSNDNIKIKNMNLEKAIEKNFGNKLNNFVNIKNLNDSKEKKINKNNDKNLYNNFTYNNKINSLNGSKKKSKFSKKIKKKIYPIKKIMSLINLKNIKSQKNDNIEENKENISKNYKYSSSSLKLENNNNPNKNLYNLKNLSKNNDSYRTSFLPLNTSYNNRNNIIYKKYTYSLRKNNDYQSPYNSKNIPKEKKLKNYYNSPFIKINNSISKENKNIIIKRNHNKILKSIFTTTTSYNSNKISSKNSFINIPYLVSDDDKHIQNSKGILKTNAIFNNYFDFKKNYLITSKQNNCYKYEKKYYKNKKKNDIPICNISKNKIPFKRKIMGLKKNEVSNLKINNKNNSKNEIIFRTNSYQNKSHNNNEFRIKNEHFSILNFNPQINKNKNIINTIYNSYTHNINSYSNKIRLNNLKYLKTKKNNNFYNNNSYSSINFNNHCKEIKNTNNFKNMNFNINYNKLKENINLLTENNNFSKYYQYPTKITKNIINDNKSINGLNKKVLINDKIINKNYIRNILHKFDSINSNDLQKNEKEVKNRILMTFINNNCINNKIRFPNSYRNYNKNSAAIEYKSFNKSLNNNQKKKNDNIYNDKILFNKHENHF